MRKASLFYHFATKDALYEAVLERLVARLQVPLEAIYASSGTFAERLDAVTETTVTALATHPYAARLLLREAMDWGPVIRGKLLDRILLVLEAGAMWVRAGQEQGAFVEGDPKQLVLSAIGLHFLPVRAGPARREVHGRRRLRRRVREGAPRGPQDPGAQPPRQTLGRVPESRDP